MPSHAFSGGLATLALDWFYFVSQPVVIFGNPTKFVNKQSDS
jgi:hypothetical protein